MPTSSSRASPTPILLCTNGWRPHPQRQLASLTSGRRIGRKHFTDTYRYVNQVPLRDSDDALLVNWFELVTTAENGKILFHNTWVNQSSPCARNVAALARQAVHGGRSRMRTTTPSKPRAIIRTQLRTWQTALAILFAAMILLAFLFTPRLPGRWAVSNRAQPTSIAAYIL